MRAVQDNVDCESCRVNLQAPRNHSTTTALVASIDRGGLSYPSLRFVGFVSQLEETASEVATALLKQPQPLKEFSDMVLPSLLKNSFVVCSTNNGASHRTLLLKVLLRKFMRPFLAYFTSKLMQQQAKRKVLDTKPLSRKVLKV